MVEACQILGVSRNTVKKLIREGALPAYTIQGVTGYRLRRHEVQALIHTVDVETPKKKATLKVSAPRKTKSR